MSNIIGYDCDGKPLRAGDRVVVVWTTSYWNHLIGCEYTVIGPCPVFDGQIEFDEPSPNPVWDWVSGHPSSFRRIDTQERGDWSEIEKATGWTPHVEVET